MWEDAQGSGLVWSLWCDPVDQPILQDIHFGKYPINKYPILKIILSAKWLVWHGIK